MPDNRDKDLKWIEIDDFTPGIITNSQYAYQAVANAASGPVPGNKNGQAQSAAGCIALPNGGLGPLPGIGSSAAPVHTPATGGGSYNLINGFFVAGPTDSSDAFFPNTNTDSIIVGQIAGSSSGNISFWLDDYSSQPPFNSNNAMTSIGPAAQTVGGPCTMTGGLTRANSTPTDVGILTWLLEYWYTGASGSNPIGGTVYLVNYPDPTAPTTNALYFLLTGSSTYPAQALCHQNRQVLLEAWQDFWAGQSEILTNEVFNYTDPPNSLALGAQQEIFVQENPFGYGAWGSISASELFLVKNRQGGVVIQGDLNSPTVTSLPGVTPCYGTMSRAAQTPIGFLYASGGRGLWSWNGGNVSQKISEALEDNFYEVTLPQKVFRGPTVDIVPWGDWVVVSGDWLMDTNTGGWWRLPQGQTTPHLWYGVSWDGTKLYAAVASPTSTYFMDVYARTVPTPIWNWKSYPIRVGTDTKNVNYLIKEVVIRAQGSGTVKALLTGIGGATNAFASSPDENATLTFEVASDNTQPSMQRLTMGLPAQDVTILMNAIGAGGPTGTTPAPIVYSVAIGYEEQNPVSSG